MTPNAGRSALYISLYRIDGPGELYGREKVVPPWVALPAGWQARLALPRPRPEAAALGEAPPQLAAGGRRGRRMAGGRPRRPRGPLPRGTDDLTGPRGRGPARPGEGVETPGHAHGQRQGGAAALRRRPTPPCPRTPGLAPPEQDRSVPATALPGPHRARTGTIPPGPPAQASPRHRCFRRRGTQRLGLARAARARRPCAARATRPVAGPVCGRHRAGKRSGRPRRGTGAGQGEGDTPWGVAPFRVKPPPLGLIVRQSRTQAGLEPWSPAAPDSPIAGLASRSNRNQDRQTAVGRTRTN